MSRLLRMNDGFRPQDNIKGGLHGQMIFGIGKHLVEYTDPFGKKCYRTEFEKEVYKNDNIIPIGGYQFAFNKMFNIAPDEDTTLRVGDLNDEAPQMKIGIPRGDYKSTKYNAETSLPDTGLTPMGGVNISALNFVFGFMIGDGGCREDNITAIAPNYKRRSLYHPIPFRMSNDGYAFQQGKYFGQSTISNGVSDPITSYYIKRFDDPTPHIVHRWITDISDNNVDTVDDSVFASTSTIPIDSYVEINLSISDADARGYFTSTSTSPRINEFGLVSGWYNSTAGDYEQLRLITHFTRPSITLEDGDSLEAIYRIYSR